MGLDRVDDECDGLFLLEGKLVRHDVHVNHEAIPSDNGGNDGLQGINETRNFGKKQNVLCILEMRTAGQVAVRVYKLTCGIVRCMEADVVR